MHIAYSPFSDSIGIHHTPVIASMLQFLPLPRVPLGCAPLPLSHALAFGEGWVGDEAAVGAKGG